MNWTHWRDTTRIFYQRRMFPSMRSPIVTLFGSATLTESAMTHPTPSISSGHKAINRLFQQPLVIDSSCRLLRYISFRGEELAKK